MAELSCCNRAVPVVYRTLLVDRRASSVANGVDSGIADRVAPVINVIALVQK
jgi:hypothetical protein